MPVISTMRGVPPKATQLVDASSRLFNDDGQLRTDRIISTNPGHGFKHLEPMAGQQYHLSYTPTGPAAESVASSQTCFSTSQTRKRKLACRTFSHKSDYVVPEPKGRSSAQDGSSRLCLPSQKLACPFFRRDPEDLSCTRACAGPGWDLTRHVKEHVFRCHVSDMTCPRCNAPFASQDELEAHHQAEEPCIPRPASRALGISRSQADRLRSKKGIAGLNEEGKWAKMYSIIFPHDKRIPSPCQYLL